jgi:hypothetical protein
MVVFNKNNENNLQITSNVNFNLLHNIESKIEKVEDLYFNAVIQTEEIKTTEKSEDVRHTEPNKQTHRNSYYLLETETKIPTERPSYSRFSFYKRQTKTENI